MTKAHCTFELFLNWTDAAVFDSVIIRITNFNFTSSDSRQNMVLTTTGNRKRLSVLNIIVVDSVIVAPRSEIFSAAGQISGIRMAIVNSIITAASTATLSISQDVSSVQLIALNSVVEVSSYCCSVVAVRSLTDVVIATRNTSVAMQRCPCRGVSLHFRCTT